MLLLYASRHTYWIPSLKVGTSIALHQTTHDMYQECLMPFEVDGSKAASCRWYAVVCAELSQEVRPQ